MNRRFLFQRTFETAFTNPTAPCKFESFIRSIYAHLVYNIRTGGESSRGLGHTLGQSSSNLRGLPGYSEEVGV